MSQRMAVSGQRKRDREWREVRPISVFAKANVPRRNGELRLSNQFSNPVAVVVDALPQCLVEIGSMQF